MDYKAQLEGALGLKDVRYEYGLDKEALFHAAIENDRGRTTEGGSFDQQKAFPTAMGVKGPLVYYTDPSATGRRVKDTFAVRWPEIEADIWWKSDFSPYPPEAYQGLLKRVVAFLNEKKATLYVQDLYAGSDPAYALPFRFVGEYATHALFCRTMFPKTVKGVKDEDAKRWTLLNVPSFHTQPDRDGSRSEAVVIVDIKNRLALVAGPMDYCGTNKKTMFTVLNYMLPKQGYLPMHCSANVGEKGDAAILFGLSGTGKTTLSADPDRKLIDLDKEAEPVIAAALSKPCTLIENVPPLKGKKIEETDPQDLDLTDRSRTENTRFAYGLDCNPVVMEGSRGPAPKTIVLLTADAFGVLPPVSILSKDEVMYHFVSGFTAKLAGTEMGVTEPKAAFSACFGAPFMPRFPSVYAELLAKKMEEADARCILLNTGWSGGGYGVGKRISIKHTRALLNAALAGQLDDVPTRKHPIFNLSMPTRCPGVPDEILDPRNTWKDGGAYDQAATKLRDMFRANFEEKGFAKLGIKPVM